MSKLDHWVPGCGIPHPNADLIKAWADGKVPLIEKQLMIAGKPFGAPLTVQFPCWKDDRWKFDVAKNSQLAFDLETQTVISTKKVKIPPLPKPGVSRVSKFSDWR